MGLWDKNKLCEFCLSAVKKYRNLHIVYSGQEGIQMGKKDFFTKILAICGTLLVWLPVLAPGVFSIVALIEDG
jgi:hypothetical protein